MKINLITKKNQKILFLYKSNKFFRDIKFPKYFLKQILMS